MFVDECHIYGFLRLFLIILEHLDYSSLNQKKDKIIELNDLLKIERIMPKL